MSSQSPRQGFFGSLSNLHLGSIFLSIISLSVVACSSPQTPTGTNTENTTQAQNANETVNVTLVSYAVTKSAYEKIIPKFAADWKAKTGQTVVFNQSYGGSGSQTRAVIDGLEADIVALALASDTLAIQKAGLIQPGWEQELPNESIVHKSVVAFVTRDANLKLTQWSDLAREDIKVITANPKTSGGARWNFLALWGAVAQTGGTEEEALTYVEDVFKHVPILPKDARESSDVFYKQGQGDVLLNYENEVLLAKQQGEIQPYFIPTDYNISIDNPVAVVDANVDKNGTREVSEAFTEYLFTPEAQREFAQVGFRPIDPAVAQEFASQYPVVKQLATIKDFGGWDQVKTKFFEDGAIFDQVQAKVNTR